MKKWLIIIINLGTLIALFLIFVFIIQPREASIGEKRFVLNEKILVELISINYITNKKFLMRAEINGEQVGIIYFDKEGKIRFDGDKEKFDHALCKAFKISEEEWKK